MGTLVICNHVIFVVCFAIFIEYSPPISSQDNLRIVSRAELARIHASPQISDLTVEFNAGEVLLDSDVVKIRHALPSLKRLQLGDSQITTKGLRTICRIGSLEHLVFSGRVFFSLGEDELECLAQLDKLKTLEFYKPKVDESGWYGISLAFEKMKNLENLLIRRANLAENCPLPPNLRMLDLSYVENADSQCIFLELRRLRHLEKAVIEYSVLENSGIYETLVGGLNVKPTDQQIIKGFDGFDLGHVDEFVVLCDTSTQRERIEKLFHGREAPRVTSISRTNANELWPSGPFVNNKGGAIQR